METDKTEADVVRRHALMQMLTERSILEEVESDRSLSETGMILQGRSLSSEDPCREHFVVVLVNLRSDRGC